MLTMWVTEGEHRRLLERCDGRPLAAWMRQTCLDEKPARTGKLPSLSPALLRQLAGMGNNLNQFVKAAKFTRLETLERAALKLLNEIQNIVKNLSDDWKNSKRKKL